MPDKQGLVGIGAFLQIRSNSCPRFFGEEQRALLVAFARDDGLLGQANIQALEQRGLEPYIATGREPHHPSWQTFFAERPAPPPDEASPKIKMAYTCGARSPHLLGECSRKLQTKIGQAIYRLRKCTVEPVIGIIKEVLGFRQFSLRGLLAAAGEWALVCLTFNLKRLQVLLAA
jgi:Transposase DDE domain